MKKNVLLLFALLLVFANINGQGLNFETPAKLFSHPLGNAGFDFPVVPLDFDFDGTQDYIGRSFDDAVTVKLGSDNGFDDSEDISYDYYSRPFQIIDFNEDGFDDIILQSYLYLYDPVALDYELVLPGTPEQILGLAILGVADFNSDGFNDLLSTMGTGSSANRLAIHYWDGQNFTKTLIDNNINLGPVRIGDLEGDGDIDIAIIDKYNPNSPALLINNGLGSFEERSVSGNSILRNLSLDFEDLDADGDCDILASNTDGQLIIYENADNYTSFPVTYVVDVSRALTTQVVDLNNDGVMEIVSLEINNGMFTLIAYQAVQPLSYNIQYVLAQFSGPPTFMTLNPNYIKNTIGFSDVDNDNDQDIIFTYGFGDDPAVYVIENISAIEGIDELSTASIQTKEPNKSIDVFPNPVMDKLMISTPFLSNQAVFTISNALGKVVKNGQLIDQSIGVHDLNSGTYVLHVQSQKETYSATFQVVE